MGRLTPKIAALLCLSVLGGASAAWAQDVRNVVEQARYPLEADGIRSGSLIFSPSLGLTQSYEDNIFRDDNAETDDFVTVVNPGINVRTDFDLHNLFFRTGGSFGYYADNDSENYEDYNIAAGGRLDVDYDTYFSLSSAYNRAHENREDADTPNSDEPIEYDLWNTKLGFTRALGVVKLYLEGLFDRFAYDDATLNGVVVDNGGRDRDIYTAYGKLAYEYFPGYNFYTSLKQDWRRYDEAGIVTRDSDGYDVNVGTDLAITGKVKGDIYIGYLNRSYDDSAFEDISALNYGGSLIWNVTGLTSLTASVARAVEETTFGDASGNLQTLYDLRVDHLLRDNLFLGANVGYTASDYESNANAGREDASYRAGLNLEYIPYDGTTFRAGYNYSVRESNRANEDFTNNRVFVGVSHQF